MAAVPSAVKVTCMIDHPTTKKKEVDLRLTAKDWSKSLSAVLTKIHKRFPFLSAMQESQWTLCINGETIDKSSVEAYKNSIAKTPAGQSKPHVQIIATAAMGGGPKSYVATVHFNDQTIDVPMEEKEPDDMTEETVQRLRSKVCKAFSLPAEVTLCEKVVIGQNVDESTIDDVDDLIAAFEQCAGRNLQLYAKLNAPSRHIRVVFNDKSFAWVPPSTNNEEADDDEKQWDAHYASFMQQAKQQFGITADVDDIQLQSVMGGNSCDLDGAVELHEIWSDMDESDDETEVPVIKVIAPDEPAQPDPVPPIAMQNNMASKPEPVPDQPGYAFDAEPGDDREGDGSTEEVREREDNGERDEEMDDDDEEDNAGLAKRESLKEYVRDVLPPMLADEYSELPEVELAKIANFVRYKNLLQQESAKLAEHETGDLDQKVEARFVHALHSLRAEGHSEYGICSALQRAQSLTLTNRDYKQTLQIIQEILKEIRPFNIAYMLELYKETKVAEERLAGQDTVLFLGYTGSGKSTSIHFLSGTQFKQTAAGHFKPVKIVSAACEKVELSHKVTESVTRFISAVPIDLRAFGVKQFGTDAKDNIMLGDTPGFFDSEGAEVDVANGLGIVNAVGKAKSLRIVIVMDLIACTGNKFEAAKKLAYTLANIVPNFKQYAPYIDFIFTKVPKEAQNVEKMQNILEIALDETQKSNPHDSALIDFLQLMSNTSNPLFVHPIESDVAKVWKRLVSGQKWISVPSQVVRSFVTDASMEKITQQINKHKQFIMRAMNEYQNQSSSNVDDDEKVIEMMDSPRGNGHDKETEGDEFGKIKIKLDELRRLRECLPTTQIIARALGESGAIIVKALSAKINAQIVKLADSNQKYHDVDAFARVLAEYKSAMADIPKMVQLQKLLTGALDEHDGDGGKMGTSPDLLQERLRSEFEHSLQKCSLAPESAVYFQKTKVFVSHFAELKEARAQRMTAIVQQVQDMKTAALQSLKQFDADKVYESMVLLTGATHLNDAQDNLISELVGELETRIVAALKELEVALQRNFKLNVEMDIDVEWNDHTAAINSAKLSIERMHAFREKFGGTKIASDIEAVYDAAIALMVQYCRDLNQLIRNTLTGNKMGKPAKTLKNAKLAMQELKSVYTLHAKIEMQTSSTYYQSISSIINYLNKVESAFNEIVGKMENDTAEQSEYASLNEYAQIIQHSGWIFEMQGKSKQNELIESISQQIGHRMQRLSQESKRIVPSLDDVGSLKKIRDVLNKLTKISFLENMLPDMAKMSNDVIEIVQNDIRKILRRTRKEFTWKFDAQKKKKTASADDDEDTKELKALASALEAVLVNAKNGKIALTQNQSIDVLVAGLRHQLHDSAERAEFAEPEEKTQPTMGMDTEMNTEMEMDTELAARQLVLYQQCQTIAGKLNELLSANTVMNIETLQQSLAAELEKASEEQKSSDTDESSAPSLNCKKLSKCLTFVKECNTIEWYGDMKSVIAQCNDAMEDYLKRYGKFQNDRLRTAFDVLMHVDKRQKAVEFSALQAHMYALSDIFFEFDTMNKRSEQYGDVYKLLYSDSDVWRQWEIFIKQKVRAFQMSLQQWAQGDPVALNIALQRVRLLSQVDWFLEQHCNMKNGFGNMYTEYHGKLVKAGSIDKVNEAIATLNFLQVAEEMDVLSILNDDNGLRRYRTAQTRLAYTVLQIFETFKSKAMQLAHSTNAESHGALIKDIKEAQKRIKDVHSFCDRFMTESDKQKMTAIWNDSIVLICTKINDLSALALRAIKGDHFMLVEEIISVCKNMVTYLSDLDPKVQAMNQKCTAMNDELNHRLEGITKHFRDEIQFSDEMIKARVNLYATNNVQYLHKALMAAAKKYPKYGERWTEIEDGIKFKFGELIKKLDSARTFDECQHILTLCDDILGSLPDSLAKTLRLDFKKGAEKSKSSNLKETETLHQNLDANNIAAVYELYTKMKKENNRKMVQHIQTALREKGQTIQTQLDQCLTSEDASGMKQNLAMLAQWSAEFPSNTQFNHMGTEFVTANTKLARFIDHKMETVQKLMPTIRVENIEQIERCLDVLLRLVDEKNPNSRLTQFNEKLSDVKREIGKFVRAYFDAELKTFGEGLNVLDGKAVNKSLNTSHLYDATKSRIVAKLLSFDGVKMSEDAKYEQMVGKAKDTLQAVNDEIVATGLVNKNLQRNAKEEHCRYFRNLKDRLFSLKSCAPALKAHIPEEETAVLYKKCTDKLKTDLEEVIGTVEDTLKQSVENNSRINEKMCDDTNDHYRLLLAMEEADLCSSEAMKKRLKRGTKQIETLIHKKVECLEKNVINEAKTADEGKFDGMIENLVEMEMMSTILLDFQEPIKQTINTNLQKFKKQHGKKVTALYSVMSHQSNSWANGMVQSYSIFKAIAISEFNQLTSAFGIDHVLQKIDGIGDDIQTQKKKDILRTFFTTCKTNYLALVKQYLMPPETLNLTPLIAKIKAIPADIKQGKEKVVWNMQTKEKAVELMSHVFALWTLQNSASYYEVEDRTNAESYLRQPHDAQMISIMRCLGIGNSRESYGKNVLNGLKLLANAFTFGQTQFAKDEDTLMPNLVEIGTGEGKSLTLAVTSSVLALMGFNINCACYSKYLSLRDYQDYEQLFDALGVQPFIVYGTFNELSENMINERGNIRDQVRALMLKSGDDEKKSDESGGGGRDASRASILLIDEVDVFFNKQFYGEYYTPGAVLRHDCIKTMTDYMWTHYEGNSNQSTLTLSTMQSSSEYQACVTVFGAEWTTIIDEQVKCMLADINTFDSPKYVVKDDKIGYKEGDQITYSATVGYKTLFAYYFEHRTNNVISARSLNDIIAMYLKCGAFSYAEIPKRFNVIMGVTGTLRHLSAPERNTMDEKYGLKVHTYMPSLFGPNKNRFDQQRDIHISTIERFNEDLKNEIIKRLKDHASPRCVFVFFEDRTKLMSFSSCPEFHTFLDQTRIITEQLTFKEKEAEIKRASQSNRITLLTKSFGRGTDFKVMDELVRNNGGPHVIQTFVTIELSEEIQIKGRTARQGGEGSYSMVLIDEELEKFAITKEDIEAAKTQEKLYDMINAKRNDKFAEEYKQITDRIDTAKEVHDNGMQFLEALHDNDVERVKTDLMSYNLGPASNTMKIAVCVDATGSMGSLLGKAKQRIREMFKRIRQILKENGHDPNSFEMQMVAYRNYNAPEQDLLLYSGWHNDPASLDKWLSTVQPNYGWANEAVEVALQFVHDDQNVNEVLVIGDAGPNTRQETDYKRKKGGHPWNGTAFATAVYFDDELEKIKQRGLKINSFYLVERAKESFQAMATATGGNCEQLDIDSANGAEQLTGLISKAVLKVCGGDALVQAYDAKFTHIS